MPDHTAGALAPHLIAARGSYANARQDLERRVAVLAGTRFELVLIDHGFHTDVPEDFRLLYCRLWKALCFSDVDLLLACGRDLGLDEDDSKVLTTALAMFPFKFWAERRCPNFMEVRAEFFAAGPHVRRVNARLPKALHLLSRTNQQIFGYFTYKWGLGPELRMDWLRKMAVYSLVGLKFARACATPEAHDEHKIRSDQIRSDQIRSDQMRAPT